MQETSSQNPEARIQNESRISFALFACFVVALVRRLSVRRARPAHAARSGSCVALATPHAHRSGAPRTTVSIFSLPFFSTLRASIPSSHFTFALFACFVVTLPSSAFSAADQYTPPPTFDGFLASLAYGAVTLAAVAVAIRQIFPKRQPSIEQEFVTKSDFEKHCNERHCKLEKDMDEIKKSIASSESKREAADRIHEERSSNIHRRVDVTTKLLYRIAGKLDVRSGDLEP